jgi:fatty acid kinase fatty acid binding subunit
MSRVRVVTDSAADIPAALVDAHQIVVVPLSVHFGSQTYAEGEDLDAQAFYELLRNSPEFPRTSQPSVGRFEEAYERLRDEGADIVSIHISARLSGTYGCAHTAAQNVGAAQIHLVDSQFASMAEGTLVLAAARMAENGKSATDIVQFVEAMRARTTATIMIGSLEHLERGGRIGRAQSMLGTLLNVKPIVAVEDGVVVPMQRARTAARAFQEMAHKARGLAPLDDLQIMHSSAPDQVREFQTLLEPIIGREVPANLLGAVIGTHVGAGAMGVLTVKTASS